MQTGRATKDARAVWASASIIASNHLVNRMIRPQMVGEAVGKSEEGFHKVLHRETWTKPVQHLPKSGANIRPNPWNSMEIQANPLVDRMIIL